MISKIHNYLLSKRDYFNKYSFIFLICYFCLICFPYIFTRVPTLDNIFSNSTIAYIIRFIMLGLLAIYGIVLMISNQIKVKWFWVCLCGLLLILDIISICTSPDNIISYSFYFTGKIKITDYTVGTYSKLTHIARFGGGLVFFFFLINAFPFCIRTKNEFTYVVLPIIVISIIAIGYTMIFERSLINDVLFNNGDPQKITSIFHSKNEYGIFLLGGSVAISFISFVNTHKYFKFLMLLLPIYLVLCFIVNCKLASVCIMVLLFFVYFDFIVRYFKRRRWFSITLISVAMLFILTFILFMCVPQLHSSGVLNKLYSKIIDTFTHLDLTSFLGRTSEWGAVPLITNGIFMVIGFSSASGYKYFELYNTLNGTTGYSLYDLHNSYVDFYAYHGIVGCLCLALIYIYVFYKLILMYKHVSKSEALFVISIFVVGILFGMAETYTLFISMSANTFVLSFIVLGYTLFQTKEVKGKYEIKGM